MNKSHLTAIVRKTLPLPTRWLMKSLWLVEPILDYGCGRCHEVNNKEYTNYKVDGYDPYYRPNGITRTHYNTVMCHYVLNVIKDPKERHKVLCHIDSLLSEDGAAYISVRNDIVADYVSSKGTWQGYIDLPLTLIHRTPGYRLYVMHKGDYAKNNRSKSRKIFSKSGFPS